MVAGAVVLAGATGWVAGKVLGKLDTVLQKIPGVTTGRNSFTAVFKSGLTKLKNVSYKYTMSLKVGLKGYVSQMVYKLPKVSDIIEDVVESWWDSLCITA